ncbi:DNA repair protein RAD51 homolog 2 isoform X1 [Herrania umbratica]|uniref:DNA repair protein RAD51 homolog 2 isoform X1 n=1 Tax=Herrania umbratica TaxID=108875 RepID=A0A6J0ZWR5_9ROSI|nr:DNA repair protein RAD51 homolog 2 isoform X1 [Herrania umbratica]
MANKLISEIPLPKSIANVFAARNISTAKDALSLTEFELMELLDVGLTEVRSALSQISEIVAPPYQTALSLMEQRFQNEHLGGHFPTGLKGLDSALCGGIPFGVLTELVGPAGIGKTQFCLKLSLLASLPTNYGGLDGRVIYIDVESKFSSRRLLEIGLRSFPEIFQMKEMAQEMAGRVFVLRPSSLSEFTQSLQQIKVSLLQNQVKMLVIDSMAALVSGEHEQGVHRQQTLSWHISFIKSLAEFSRIPVIVTNQVRSQSHDEASQYSFQVQSRDGIVETLTRYDSHLVAALGIHWAHAVTTRLVLEAKSGQRFIKVAKSPISPPLAFPFHITSSGISLISDEGMELMGPEINSIHCQGHNEIINFRMDSLV